MPTKGRSVAQQAHISGLAARVRTQPDLSPTDSDPHADLAPTTSIKAANLEALRDRGDRHRQDKRNLKRRIDRAEDVKEAFEAQLAAAESRYRERLVQQLSESDLRVSNAEKRLEAMRQQHASLQSAFLESRIEIDDLNRKLTRLSTKNSCLHKETDSARQYRLRSIVSRQKRATVTRKTKYLKERGVITPMARELVRDLVVAGVSQKRIDEVIHAVANSLEVDIPDHLTRRSVNRIVKEGYVASMMQAGALLSQATAFTASSDGTSHRNLEYMSHHITLNSTQRDPNSVQSSQPKTLFLGIVPALDHTSETQLAGWNDIFGTIVNIFNESPLGLSTSNQLSIEKLIQTLKGFSSDHAEDQKKLAKLFVKWKLECEYIIRGQKLMSGDTPARDILATMAQRLQARIDELGGDLAWNSLSALQKEQHRVELYRSMCLELGEQQFLSLSDAEQQAANLFVWAGCCMHKEMNSVKGGTAAMASYWTEHPDDGPLILMNRDNAAAYSDSSSTSAAARAKTVSQGGAIKLASLAGAVFGHKDTKKGQQDSYRIFLESRLGYALRFPDTSNNRFQMYCRAAGVLILHRRLILDFLDLVRHKKESGSFNHLEHNVFKGLSDIPTLTELAVLILYSQAISHPYMRTARNIHGTPTNHLDLGPLHNKVKDHCSRLAQNPDLILSPSACFTTATLDGQPWEEPESFYAVQQLMQEFDLPHLKPIFVRFVLGAHEVWDRFTTEFAEGGVIQTLSEASRQDIFINPTNDHNEGELGSMRSTARHAPSTSNIVHNGRRMYSRNKVRGWMRLHCGDNEHRYIRRIARKLDSEQLGKKQRKKQADHDKQKAAAKRLQLAVAFEKQAKRKAVLNSLKLVSLAEVDVPTAKCKVNVAELKNQISWYSKIAKDDLVRGYSTGKKKPELQAILIGAINRYNARTHSTQLPCVSEHADRIVDEMRIDEEAEEDWEELPRNMPF